MERGKRNANKNKKQKTNQQAIATFPFKIVKKVFITCTLLKCSNCILLEYMLWQRRLSQHAPALKHFCTDSILNMYFFKASRDEVIQMWKLKCSPHGIFFETLKQQHIWILIQSYCYFKDRRITTRACFH